MNTMLINQRIKESRIALGLSQSKFAKRIAISSSYVAEMETYKKLASERIIRLVVAEFNINDTWLRTGNGSMFDGELDVQISKMISAFKSLSPTFKAYAVNHMEELSALSEESKSDRIPDYRRGMALLLQER